MFSYVIDFTSRLTTQAIVFVTLIGTDINNILLRIIYVSYVIDITLRLTTQAMDIKFLLH